MPELAEVTKIELVKNATGHAIKVNLRRDDESLPPKKRYACDYISQNAPESVAKRWFGMLGYESASWDSFFNQDVFDLIGLRVTADFEDKVIETQNGSWEVVSVSNIKPDTSNDNNSREKVVPVSSVTRQVNQVPQDDIPF